MNQTQIAILKTLAYADIFDYPLTLNEIGHWLIWTSSAFPPTFKDLQAVITKISKINKYQQYYFLTGRDDLVKIRQQRIRFSQLKWKLARRIGNWLKLIPSINLVAVTGALAMDNASTVDDIDLMIVTTNNRLWLTRFFSVLLLELLRVRRRPRIGANQQKNRVCLNLFLDQSTLKLALSRRNLYTAHEVCQAKLIWDRDDSYKKFIVANLWIKKYLPGILIDSDQSFFQPHSKVKLLNVFTPLEKIFFYFQYFYMKSKVTREKISLHSAFFHPRPTSQIILKKYQQRLKSLGLK